MRRIRSALIPFFGGYDLHSRHILFKQCAHVFFVKKWIRPTVSMASRIASSIKSVTSLTDKGPDTLEASSSEFHGHGLSPSSSYSNYLYLQIHGHQHAKTSFRSTSPAPPSPAYPFILPSVFFFFSSSSSSSSRNNPLKHSPRYTYCSIALCA